MMHKASPETAPELGARRDRSSPRGETWDEEDRRLALEKLTVFSVSEEFVGTFLRAGERFWGPLRRELDDEELLRLHAEPSIAFNFQGFFAIEYEAARGQTILEILLERHGEKLPPGERAFLRALARSRLGIYEWVAASSRLRDIWRGGEEFPIDDPSAAYGFRHGELIAARLTRPPGGKVYFEWDLYVFPHWYREDLLAELQAEYAGRAAAREADSERAFSRRACPLVHQLLFQLAGPIGG